VVRQVGGVGDRRASGRGDGGGEGGEACLIAGDQRHAETAGGEAARDGGADTGADAGDDGKGRGHGGILWTE
jgi:hypothetical protein